MKKATNGEMTDCIILKRDVYSTAGREGEVIRGDENGNESLF